MNLIRTSHTLVWTSLSQICAKPKALTRLPCILPLLEDMSCLPLAAQVRHQHTVVTPGNRQSMTRFQKIRWDWGFYGKLALPKIQLAKSSVNLCTYCSDFIDFNEFVNGAKIPDTFFGWFQLLQLHMWMLIIKFNQMGKEGMLMRDFAYQKMWVTVEERLKANKGISAIERQKALKDCITMMNTSILQFDEGLLGSDKVLANSLWVQLYDMNPDIRAQDLELMVEYVRKQVHHLDQLDPMPIMKPGYVSFLPLFGEQVDQAKCDENRKSLPYT